MLLLRDRETLTLHINDQDIKDDRAEKEMEDTNDDQTESE